jgi:hypothetical protein
MDKCILKSSMFDDAKMDKYKIRNKFVKYL